MPSRGSGLPAALLLLLLLAAALAGGGRSLAGAYVAPPPPPPRGGRRPAAQSCLRCRPRASAGPVRRNEHPFALASAAPAAASDLSSALEAAASPRPAQAATAAATATATAEEDYGNRETMPWTQNIDEHGPFDHEDWAWAYSSVPPEASASSGERGEPRLCADVDGLIPPDLRGTLLRIGPGLFERGGRRYEHVLDGDGFVSSFRISGGRCYYQGRFVETEAFLKEQAADMVLHRNVFGTQRSGGLPWSNAGDLALKNVANTNLLAWGGRMFALWEAGAPHELDPETLAVIHPSSAGEERSGPFRGLGSPRARIRGVTTGIDALDRLLGFGRAFTAHPHVVDGGRTLAALRSGQNPATGRLHMEFVEYDKSWNIKSSTRYEVEGAPAAPHDFSASRDYYGFFQNRFELDALPYLLGLKSPAQVLQVPLGRPARLHLVPRSRSEGSAAIVVDVPRYFCIHNLCRMEQSDDDKTVTVYSNGWNLDDARFFPPGQASVPFLGSWGGRCPDFANQRVPPSALYRTVVDVEEGRLVSHMEVAPGLVMEFPTQEQEEEDEDEGRPGDPNGRRSAPDLHSIYCSAASSDYTSLPGTGHAKVDTRSNTVEYWWAGPKIFTGEMTPVPKRNGDGGAWLLTLLFDASRRTASLAILDSHRFGRGPVARIHLPHSLAYCLHGAFVED